MIHAPANLPRNANVKHAVFGARRYGANERLEPLVPHPIANPAGKPTQKSVTAKPPFKTLFQHDRDSTHTEPN
jgi:hypothetical protein